MSFMMLENVSHNLLLLAYCQDIWLENWLEIINFDTDLHSLLSALGPGYDRDSWAQSELEQS